MASFGLPCHDPSLASTSSIRCLPSRVKDSGGAQEECDGNPRAALSNRGNASHGGLRNMAWSECRELGVKYDQGPKVSQSSDSLMLEQNNLSEKSLEPKKQ